MDKMKLAAFGERLKVGSERLKIGSAEIGRKVSGKMKEILQVQSQEAKMVDEATSDTLEEPNWGLNLRICNLLNSEEFNGPEVVRAIKKKFASKNPVSQRLSLELLEACAMNCDKVFSELASEKVLDEMVKMIDNPQTHYINKEIALRLIGAWGKSDDLAYLPIFKQTYMNLKARNIRSSVEDDENSASDLSSLEPGINKNIPAPPENYPFPIMHQEDADQNALVYHGGALSVEEKKEFLVITRNSIEILSSMLNTDTQQKPAKDDLMLSMVEKCKESQPIIQRVIESIGDDEPLFFEALNLHDELEHVLAKYEELELADPPPDGQVRDDSCITSGQKGHLSEGKEAEQKTTLVSENTEVDNDNRNMEK